MSLLIKKIFVFSLFSAFILFALLTAQPVASQDFELENFKHLLTLDKAKILFNISDFTWKREETSHFIYYYKKQSHYSTYSKQAEKYFEKIKADLGSEKDPPEKCTIYLVPEPSLWHQFLNAIGMHDAAGFYSESEIYFSCKKTGLYKNAEKTFAHEICHLIFMHFWGQAHCPLWLNEGMAQYQSNEVYRFPKKFIPASDHGNRTRFGLLELTALEKYPKTSKDNWSFYMQSQWLITFLIKNNPPVLFHVFLRGTR